MRAIPEMVGALLLAGAASCVAYDQSGYQGPPGAPPAPYPQPQYQDRSPGGYPGYPDDRYGSQGSPESEVGFFYQELSPYGDWIFTFEYGWSWLPRNTVIGWRPYTYGQWVPSDYGWFWVSYEPFGWATYHYGRWAYHPRFGWLWLPGRTWGPAWVSWQAGNGYVGWAPLPPEIGFDASVGLLLGGFDLRFGLGADAYTFVDERNFLDRDPYRYAQPVARNVTIIQNTTNITNYTIVNNRVVNRGVDVQRIERSTGRRLQPLRVAETETDKREQVRGDQVVAYRPPRVRLDSVKVDESQPRRGRPERPPATPAQREPSARGGRAIPPAESEGEVAPRVRWEAPVSQERVQHQEQQERQKLDTYERSERERLAKLHDEEQKKAKTQAEAAATAQRQAQEKQALEENLRRAEQQLEARQAVERQAAQATPPPGKQKAADQKGKNPKKEEKGKKKPPADEPPPPF